MTFHVQVVSETDLMLYLHGELSATTTQQLLALQQAFTHAFAAALIDTVPAYQSLLLCFHPRHTEPPAQRLARVQALAKETLASFTAHAVHTDTITVPVYYGPEAGLDFHWVCAQTGLNEKQLIALHSQCTYHVFAVGFSPGFAFMGQLPAALQLPRRHNPRDKVPRGSLAIAHDQTAIYPMESPGGWHLIGRSPTVLFDANKTPSHLFSVGASVRFQPISRAEYLAQGGEL